MLPHDERIHGVDIQLMDDHILPFPQPKRLNPTPMIAQTLQFYRLGIIVDIDSMGHEAMGIALEGLRANGDTPVAKLVLIREGQPFSPDTVDGLYIPLALGNQFL